MVIEFEAMKILMDSSELREIDGRGDQAMQVSLMWSESQHVCVLAHLDVKSRTAHIGVVDSGCAADAFRHPYTYLSSLKPYTPSSVGVVGDLIAG